MAAAFVQKDTGGATSSATTVATAGITTTAGNLLIACVAWDKASNATATIADSKSNTWDVAITQQEDARHGQRMRTWYSKNLASAGASHTVTVTFSELCGFRTLIVHEVSGCDTTAPFDQFAVDNAEAGTAVDTAAATTTTDGQYLFAAVVDDSGTGTFSAGGSFVERATVLASTAEMQSEDQIQTSAGSIQAEWTLSNTDDCLCQMATFKAAAGAAAIPKKPIMSRQSVPRAAFR